MAEKLFPSPAPELVLTDLEQLKVASDPLRLQILDTMSAEPRRGWTAKALADVLQTKQTKLYHHLGLTQVEIADTLGIPLGTVKSRLRYAGEAMRAAIEADDRGSSAVDDRRTG